MLGEMSSLSPLSPPSSTVERGVLFHFSVFFIFFFLLALILPLSPVGTFRRSS